MGEARCTPSPRSALDGLIDVGSGALGSLDRLAAMGAAGRAIVEREFSWDAAGTATLRLYEELLDANRRRPRFR